MAVPDASTDDPGAVSDALPTLDAQPYLLDTPDDATGVVHALVCDRLLTAGGPV
jgi:hypothetical protein